MPAKRVAHPGPSHRKRGYAMSAASGQRSSGNRLFVLACSAALTLAACSKKEDEAPKEAACHALDRARRPARHRRLAGLHRARRIRQGLRLGHEFEAETGCKVNVKVANTSDEMVTLMTSGAPPPSPPGDASWPPAGNAPYDLVTASGDASLRLIRGGTVQPIGLDRVPSYATSIRACRKPRGTSSTANTGACPTSGARTC